MHNYIWCPYYLPSFMKFGSVVSEICADKLCDGQDKNNMSPHKSGGRHNDGQKERLCLIIDKCRHQKLCKRAQKILAATPLCVMASRYNPCE